MHRYERNLHPTLDGVSLQVDRCDTVAITGPSGSGKTTLLSILGGLEGPMNGSVTVVGCDGRRRDPGSAVAWVLQTTNILSGRSALDNVVLGGLGSGRPRSVLATEASRVMSAVGLGGRELLPARFLSGGETQRLSIARALLAAKPFILADEPTGQLDRISSVGVADALFESASRAGVIVATHDRELAARCDRVLQLEQGRLVSV